jgi:hypothetical protein
MKKYREFVIWPDDKQPAQTEWSGLRLFNNPDGYKLSNGDVRVIEHSAITELESQLKLALECVRFYADKNNWHYLDIVNDRKCARIDDVDWSDGKWTPQTKDEHETGGKLARETLKILTDHCVCGEINARNCPVHQLTGAKE